MYFIEFRLDHVIAGNLLYFVCLNLWRRRHVGIFRVYLDVSSRATSCSSLLFVPVELERAKTAQAGEAGCVDCRWHQQGRVSPILWISGLLSNFDRLLTATRRPSMRSYHDEIVIFPRYNCTDKAHTSVITSLIHNFIATLHILQNVTQSIPS